VAEELIFPYGEKEDVWRVIAYLLALPISPRLRKLLLWEWCKWIGVDMTGEMVEMVTGRPAGEY